MGVGRSGQKGSVDSVNTLGFGSGCTTVGLARIAYLFRSSLCFRGLECGSSPTSGTVFPQVRGLFVFLRVHIVHTLASDLMFRVSGVPERPIRLCGGAAAYGGPGTALCDLFWVFILVRPSVGFTRTPIHCGQGRAQHDLLNILQIDRGLRPVRNFRSLIPVHAGTRGERHDLATDPELKMSSLSLASRWAARRRAEPGTEFRRYTLDDDFAGRGQGLRLGTSVGRLDADRPQSGHRAVPPPDQAST
jgi:hypothetical protein